MAKNPPSIAADWGSIPDPGTKTPQPAGPLSPSTTRESVSHKRRPHVMQRRVHVPQLTPDAAKERLKKDSNADMLVRTGSPKAAPVPDSFRGFLIQDI